MFDLDFVVLLVYGLVMVVSVGLYLFALIDAIRVPSDSDYRAGTKVTWVLVILFLGCLGALIYLAVGRPSPARG
ncbi:MAG: PLDc N-terminal domain-containing protein [Armatimonadota bacterium]